MITATKATSLEGEINKNGSRLAFEPAARGIINSSAKSNWTICVECPEFDGAARLNASKSK
jgi:hypothetical protein